MDAKQEGPVDTPDDDSLLSVGRQIASDIRRRLDVTQPGNHKFIIFWASILARTLTALIINCCARWLPLFDTSPLLETTSPLLRWDTFHFVNIAAHGGSPEWEHELAFDGSLPLVLSIVSNTTQSLIGKELSYSALASTGSWLIGFVDLFVSLELYDITMLLTKAPAFSLLTSLLYCLPSSPPAVLYAPYTEPFFASSAFEGMKHCLENNFGRAIVKFAIAQSIRSSGILLWAFPIWYKVAEPALRSLILDFKGVRPFRLLGPTTAYLGCLAMLAIAFPVALLGREYYLQHLTKVRNFCTSTRMRPWCMDGEWTHWTSYSFVQDHYWNVGFLRYWEPAQIPNFLISAPVYALNFFYASHIIIAGLKSYFGKPTSPSPFAKQFLPFALHGLGYSLILFFCAHVQIMLRQVSSLPITYWGAAALLSGQFGERGRFWGRMWVMWSVMWGVVSCILWATFLPPA